MNDTQRQRLRALGAKQYKAANPAPQAAPISTAALAPVQPIAIRPMLPASKSDEALGFIEQTAKQNGDAFTQSLAAATENAGKERLASRDAYADAQLNQVGQVQAESQLYDQLGVNSAEKELNVINNQMIAEQHALMRRIQQIEKNSEGMFGGAVDQEIQKAKDESLYRQADLAIIQMSKQGQYDSARTIADRAVAALVEQDQRKVDALKTIYEDNKDLFTTAEQRQFQVAQKDRETEIANKEYRLRAEFDQKIKQSDPLYQAQLAKARADAAKAAGELGGSADAMAQKNETLALAKALRSDTATGKKEAVGASPAKFFNTLTLGALGSAGLQPDRTAYEQKVDTLKASLTLENLSLLKGPMSDKDLLFLTAIGSSLNTNMSEKEFNSELERVIGKLETAGASSAPSEGQTHNYNGVTYVVRNGEWVPQ
jgi:hypothetical protein